MQNIIFLYKQFFYFTLKQQIIIQIFKHKNQTKKQNVALVESKQEQGQIIKKKQAAKTYSVVTFVSMALNTAIGTGLLNLPNKIAAASITTSIITIFVVGVFQFICSIHYLSVIQRTHLINEYEQLQSDIASADINKKVNIITSIEKANQQDVQQQDPIISPHNQYISGDENFELDLSKPMPNIQLPVSFLIKKYFGKIWYIIFQVIMSIFIFFTNVSYTNVVSSSLSSLIPISAFLKPEEEWQCETLDDFKKSSCNKSYWLYTGILTVCGLILMNFDLSSQSGLQNFFTFCRLFVLLLVFLVTVYCLATTPYLDETEYIDNNYINPYTPYTKFTFKTFSNMASALTFSIMYHHGLPMVLEPVKNSHQKYLQQGLLWNSVLLVIITILVALPAALYFGPQSPDLVTLNFSNWTGSSFNRNSKKNIFAVILNYTMRLLPPIYIIFTIPVRGLIVSANLLELIPQNKRTNKKIIYCINVLCVIPSIIIGGIFKDLGALINFTSLFGYIAVAAAEFLQIACNKKCKELGIKGQFNWFNNNILCVIVVLWYAFSLIFTIYSLL